MKNLSTLIILIFVNYFPCINNSLFAEQETPSLPQKNKTNKTAKPKTNNQKEKEIDSLHKLTNKNPSDKNRKFVAVPLPFYGTSTGLGISLKMLHTNVWRNLYFDSISIATTEKQYASFNSIGQEKFFFSPNIFWEFQFGGTHLDIRYYGKGNHNELGKYAQYKHQSYILTTKAGLNLIEKAKLYLLHSHKMKRLVDFENHNGDFSFAWNALHTKKIKETRIGYGLSYKNIDSETMPKKGVTLSYDFLIAQPWIVTNYYSFRESIISIAGYIPIKENFSHASRFYYQKVSDSAPFYEDPNIRVRGIEKERHKDRLSYAIQNEERIYLSDKWAIVPFWDFGRVMPKLKFKDFFNDLHLGYGLGVRYTIKKILVVRLDAAISKGGEEAFIFNYGHSF